MKREFEIVRLVQWHFWFAWRPVSDEFGNRLWWTTVWRQGRYNVAHKRWEWRYKPAHEDYARGSRFVVRGVAVSSMSREQLIAFIGELGAWSDYKYEAFRGRIDELEAEIGRLRGYKQMSKEEIKEWNALVEMSSMPPKSETQT